MSVPSPMAATVARPNEIQPVFLLQPSAPPALRVMRNGLLLAQPDIRLEVDGAEMPPSDPVAPLVRWAPMFVPLIGAMIACNTFLIGYFALVHA
jgi:hypothetical protein